MESSSIPKLASYTHFDGDEEDYKKKASQELRNNRIKLIAVSVFSIATPLLVDAVAIGIATTFPVTPIALTAAGALGGVAGLVHLIGIANICLACSYKNYLKKETLDQTHAVLENFYPLGIDSTQQLTVDPYILYKNGLIREEKKRALHKCWVYQRLTSQMSSVHIKWDKALNSSDFKRSGQLRKEFSCLKKDRNSVIQGLRCMNIIETEAKALEYENEAGSLVFY